MTECSGKVLWGGCHGCAPCKYEASSEMPNTGPCLPPHLLHFQTNSLSTQQHVFLVWVSETQNLSFMSPGTTLLMLKFASSCGIFSPTTAQRIVQSACKFGTLFFEHVNFNFFESCTHLGMWTSSSRLISLCSHRSQSRTQEFLPFNFPTVLFSCRMKDSFTRRTTRALHWNISAVKVNTWVKSVFQSVESQIIRGK